MCRSRPVFFHCCTPATLARAGRLSYPGFRRCRELQPKRQWNQSFTMAQQLRFPVRPV